MQNSHVPVMTLFLVTTCKITKLKIPDNVLCLSFAQISMHCIYLTAGVLVCMIYGTLQMQQTCAEL